MKPRLAKRLACGGLMLACLLAALAQPVRGEERIWTSAEGKEVTGELLYSDETQAILKINGKVLPMPLSRLSQGDRDYLATWRRDFWQVRAIDPGKVMAPTEVRPKQGRRIVRANLSVLCPDQPGKSFFFKSGDVWLEVEEGGQTSKIKAYTVGLVEKETGKIVFPKDGVSYSVDFRDCQPKVPVTPSVLFNIPDRARIVGIGIKSQAAVPYR